MADLAALPCFGLLLTVLSDSALSLEPYGLSLPISMSSCSIADRQSPTLLSMSSGLSGDSTDLSHKGRYAQTQYAYLKPELEYTQMPVYRFNFLIFCFSSTTLKLDGVKRVWGREGYLAQREAVEEVVQVEVPSPLQSSSQQGDTDSSHTQSASTPTPEPEQEKQQLASSLFVGLGSHSSGPDSKNRQCFRLVGEQSRI